MRLQGLPGYAIHPEGARAEYFPAAYLEPSESFPERLFGLDAGSRPEAQAAMERARDTGLPSVSQPLTLYRDAQPGFIVFVPVYRAGPALASVEARRRALAGAAGRSDPQRLRFELSGADLHAAVRVDDVERAEA